jgi:hypothetical protein
VNRTFVIPMWVLVVVLVHGVALGLSLMGVLWAAALDSVGVGQFFQVVYIIAATAYLTYIFVQCYNSSEPQE